MLEPELTFRNFNLTNDYMDIFMNPRDLWKHTSVWQRSKSARPESWGPLEEDLWAKPGSFSSPPAQTVGSDECRPSNWRKLFSIACRAWRKLLCSSWPVSGYHTVLIKLQLPAWVFCCLHHFCGSLYSKPYWCKREGQKFKTFTSKKS